MPKGETSFYFNVIKFQLFDKFTISPNNSYLSNTIQVLSIIWTIIDNKSQYVTIRHNKTQYDTINKILIIIGVSSLENILTLLDLQELGKCRKKN